MIESNDTKQSQDGLIAKVAKNAVEELRITLAEWKGRMLFGVRVWWLDGDTWKPSRKGFACSPERLPELREALEEAEKRAREQGLLNDEMDPAQNVGREQEIVGAQEELDS